LGINGVAVAIPQIISRASYGVIQTYASQERYAVKNLANQGYDAFCPLEHRPSKADPARMVETPLFPCYVFVLLGRDQPWRSIDSTYGVIRLLTDRHRDSPSPLLMHDLDDRVTYALEKLRKSVTEPFAPGTIVRITQGPWKSFEGTVEKLDKKMRLWVLLSIFNRDTRVEFGPTDLEEVSQ
jgi:transcriptional antiterminator RfaH